MIQLDALGASGVYSTRNRLTLPDVSGKPIIEMSQAPRLFVYRCLAALRGAEPLPVDQRITALARAGRAFSGEVIDGLTAEEYHHYVSRLAGLPITIVRAAGESHPRGAARGFPPAPPREPQEA